MGNTPATYKPGDGNGHVYLYYFEYPDPIPFYDRSYPDDPYCKRRAGERVLWHNRRGRIAFTMTNQVARPSYY